MPGGGRGGLGSATGTAGGPSPAGVLSGPAPPVPAAGAARSQLARPGFITGCCLRLLLAGSRSAGTWPPLVTSPPSSPCAARRHPRADIPLSRAPQRPYPPTISVALRRHRAALDRRPRPSPPSPDATSPRSTAAVRDARGGRSGGPDRSSRRSRRSPTSRLPPTVAQIVFSSSCPRRPQSSRLVPPPPPELP